MLKTEMLVCSSLPMLTFLEHNGLDCPTYFHNCPTQALKWRCAENGGRQMGLCIHDVPRTWTTAFCYSVSFCPVLSLLFVDPISIIEGIENARGVFISLLIFPFINISLFSILLWWGAVSAHCLGGQGTRTISLAFKLLQQRQQTRLNFLFYLS